MIIKKMIYLDNSATSHNKPKSVITAMMLGATKSNFNMGRSGYTPAVNTHLKSLEMRYKICEMFGTKNVKNVIITKNCTESLNLALNSMAIKNGHIIVSAFEHNSVLRTIYNLKEKFNISYSVVKPHKNGQIETEKIKRLVRKNTFLVVINHTSNVTGDTQDLKKIGKFCKKNKLKFLVDAAQSAGHEHIDVEKYNINALALAGHKSLLGPQGISILVVNKITLKPLIFGGTGSNSLQLKQSNSLPEGMEAGTQNVPAILGLLAALNFVQKNQKKINKKINILTKMLLDGLNHNPKITLYSRNTHSGVVALAIENISSCEVSNELYNKFRICTRCGLHCAPLIHKHLKTEKDGLIRISIGYYNTKREIKKVIFALNSISENNP